MQYNVYYRLSRSFIFLVFHFFIFYFIFIFIFLHLVVDLNAFVCNKSLKILTGVNNFNVITLQGACGLLQGVSEVTVIG